MATHRKRLQEPHQLREAVKLFLPSLVRLVPELLLMVRRTLATR